MVAIITAGTFSAAFAQQPNTFSPDPKTCVSNVSALDTNGDSYVDSREMAEYGRIATNSTPTATGGFPPVKP